MLRRIYRLLDAEPKCEDCRRVERLFERRMAQYNKTGSFPNELGPVNLHADYKKLELCASQYECLSCRVFRQAILLNQITIDDAMSLLEVQDPVSVALLSNSAPSLRVSIGISKEELAKTVTVSCKSRYTKDYRKLSEDPFDSRVLGRASKWLNDCCETHSQCRRPWSSKNPTRLLWIVNAPDIESNQQEIRVQLVHDQGKRNDYVALSYCWGPDSDKCPIVRDGKTMTENLQLRMKQFSYSVLPATIQEAILFTKRLGIDFIWIDSVCIIQEGDNHQDFNQEAPKMHEVYGNALFTLSVCSNDRVTHRMVGARTAWSYRDQACKLSNQFISAVPMPFDEMRARSPLSSRGWTLQEERLSPRILYWTGQCMYWSCAERQRIEVNLEQVTAVQLQDHGRDDGHYLKTSPQKFWLSCWEESGDVLYKAWLDVVKSYCSRRVSKRGDRYAAISGLAVRYQLAQISDRYIAGLWRKQFAEDLAWSVTAGQLVDETKNLRSMAPSWSWVSLPFCTNITNSLDRPSKQRGSCDFQLLQLLIQDASDSGSICKEFPVEYMGETLQNRGEKSAWAADVVAKGQCVKAIKVCARFRRLIEYDSKKRPWSKVVFEYVKPPKFVFDEEPEQSVHSVDPKSGYIMAYENRKREAVGQLDYHQDADYFEQGDLEIYCLEISRSAMLLLKKLANSQDFVPNCQGYCRIGVSYDYREDFFEGIKPTSLVLV
jgi:heterokaryon incompatibility protein (HET)